MFISWVIAVSVTTLRAVHSILPPLWTAAITNPATITASCSSFNYLSVGGVRAVGANPEQDPLHHPGPGGHTLGLVASPDRGSSRQFLHSWEKTQLSTSEEMNKLKWDTCEVTINCHLVNKPFIITYTLGLTHFGVHNIDQQYLSLKDFKAPWP